MLNTNIVLFLINNKFSHIKSVILYFLSDFEKIKYTSQTIKALRRIKKKTS